jgi:hypothetical protein
VVSIHNALRRPCAFNAPPAARPVVAPSRKMPVPTRSDSRRRTRFQRVPGPARFIFQCSTARHAPVNRSPYFGSRTTT